MIQLKKEEKTSYIKALVENFELPETFIQSVFNQLVKPQNMGIQLELFAADTG